MKRRVYRIGYLTAAVLAITAVSGCNKSKEADNSGKEKTVEVSLPVVDSVVLYKTYPGTVYSTDAADVVARVNGEILSTHFTGGKPVKKGQLLFVIESSKYRDLVQQAEANLAAAKSKYEYATKQLEAYEKAYKSAAVSQMDLIQARSDKEQALSTIRSAEASLKTARQNLSYCNVIAPISGTIMGASYDVGSYVGGEGSPVVLSTIFDENALAVKFHIEDGQYQQMVRNNGALSNPIYRHVPLTFTNSLPHDYFIDLYYESPQVDVSTGTLLMKGKVKNVNEELKDGMYCTVHLPYGNDSKAILIRDSSIGTDQLGKYVYVVNDSNKVVYRHIEVGELYKDTLRIVTKGLNVKDRYVTKAMLNVRNGESVTPKLVK
ncbi:MAG: efflux RND transporter periplasmic adaptor subunit [Muribaculaceae bacterium]|nr:efflux RND transporter periplasmic adaptor subunit [Muribaculaceae bacterium]